MGSTAPFSLLWRMFEKNCNRKLKYSGWWGRPRWEPRSLHSGSCPPGVRRRFTPSPVQDPIPHPPTPPPTHTLAQGQCERVAGKPQPHDPRLGSASEPRGSRDGGPSLGVRGAGGRGGLTASGLRCQGWNPGGSSPPCGEVWLCTLKRQSPSFSHCSQARTMLKAPFGVSSRRIHTLHRCPVSLHG